MEDDVFLLYICKLFIALMTIIFICSNVWHSSSREYPVLLMKKKNRIASLPVSVIFINLRSRIGTFVYTMPEKF
jgi:hypothetical protein